MYLKSCCIGNIQLETCNVILRSIIRDRATCFIFVENFVIYFKTVTHTYTQEQFWYAGDEDQT